MIRLCWSSVSDTAITQMQDILGLDNTARMNTPSTLGGNWQWRLADFSQLDDALAQKLADLTVLYGRCAEEKPQADESEESDKPKKDKSADEKSEKAKEKK